MESTHVCTVHRSRDLIRIKHECLLVYPVYNDIGNVKQFNHQCPELQTLSKQHRPLPSGLNHCQSNYWAADKLVESLITYLLYTLSKQNTNWAFWSTHTILTQCAVQVPYQCKYKRTSLALRAEGWIFAKLITFTLLHWYW